MTDKVSTAPGWSDETLKKVGASLDDGHYNLGMCRSTYAALCCERERNAALSAEVERLKVFVKQCADGDGFNLTARARAALGE